MPAQVGPDSLAPLNLDPLGEGLQLKSAGGAERPGRFRMFRWMVADLGPLAGRAFTPEVGLYAAGALAGTFGLAWLDDDVQSELNDAYSGTFKDVLEVVDYLGGPKINAPVAALAGVSLVTRNRRFQDAAWTSLQTLVYAGILGYALKAAFGRDRPERTDDPYDFFVASTWYPVHGRGNSSFPSGHAIASYGIITPWVLYYPSVLTYALYLLPTGTAISRVAVNKHWPTDIAVGALIGVAMGRYLTHRHQAEAAGRSGVEFSFLQDGRLFAVRLHL